MSHTRVLDMAQVLLWMWLRFFFLKQHLTSKVLNIWTSISNAKSHTVGLLFNWLSFFSFYFILCLCLFFFSFQAYCLWRAPCSCLHLLLGCAPVLSVHVKLCSVLNLWLPPSLTHPISISMVFPSPSHSSISLFLFVPQHFLHPPPTFSSQSYLGFPSLFTSLPLSVSPEFTPLLHLSLFHLYLLSALPTPTSPPPALISLLSFILSASPHLAYEFSFPMQPSDIACHV